MSNRLQAIIQDAIDDGINLRVLLIATGLDRDTFLFYHENHLFNQDQSRAILYVIRHWRSTGNT